MLEFDPSWRFSSSPGELPIGAVQEFENLIPRIVAQGNRRVLLEHFKRHFAAPADRPYYPSSNESWAESDLEGYIRDAAQNAPLFIDAFYTACEELKVREIGVPDVALMNRILREHSAGYEIAPPALLARTPHVPVAMPERVPSLNESAQAAFQQSVALSDRLLAEGHERPAVQELLWLLESVSTAFKGVDTGNGAVKGVYFNKIVRELRRNKPGTALDQVLGWIEALHGYLSSPTGGGIRHGTDLNASVGNDLAEARLFCNLIRSYTAYLLAEHERMTRSPGA